MSNVVASTIAAAPEAFVLSVPSAANERLTAAIGGSNEPLLGTGNELDVHCDTCSVRDNADCLLPDDGDNVDATAVLTYADVAKFCAG